jgi:hypothetical protein
MQHHGCHASSLMEHGAAFTSDEHGSQEAGSHLGNGLGALRYGVFGQLSGQH